MHRKQLTDFHVQVYIPHTLAVKLAAMNNQISRNLHHHSVIQLFCVRNTTQLMDSMTQS